MGFKIEVICVPLSLYIAIFHLKKINILNLTFEVD